jgi:hypothetical protein
MLTQFDTWSRIKDILGGVNEQDIVESATGVHTPEAGPEIPGLTQAGNVASEEIAEPFGPPSSMKSPDWVNSPAAQQFEKTAQNYDPGLYTEGGVVRNTPQVYGQAGSPYNADTDRPKTPHETDMALREINKTPEAQQKWIDQHTLGFGMHNPQRQAGYNRYVAQSRAEQDAAKEQQLYRAYRNRADIDDRNARTANQMANYNSMIQGGGSFAGEDPDVPLVTRRGGLTFVRGRNRPMNQLEAAEVENRRAQSEWLRARPQIATDATQAKYDLQDRNAALKLQLAKMGVEPQMINAFVSFMDKAADNKRADAMFEESKRQFGITEKNSQAVIAAANKLREAETSGILGRDARMRAEFLSDFAGKADLLAKVVTMQQAAAKENTWGGMMGPDPANIDRTFDMKTGKLTSKVSPGDNAQRVADLAATIKMTHKVDPTFVFTGPVAEFIASHPELFSK